jgi:uncharacterized protein (TIRG00374 family)
MASRGSQRWVRIAKTVLGISLLAGLLLWNDNASQLITVFSEFNSEFILALFAISLGLNAISSIKWSLFLPDRAAKVSQFRLFSLYLIGKFFSNFLPSMVGGDVARAYILGREISSHSKSAASVLMERATGMIGLALLAGIFSILNYRILENPIISLSVLVAVLGCVVGVVLFYWPPLKALILRIVGIVPLVRRFSGKFERLINAIEYFRPQYRVLFLSLLLSIAFHFLASMNVYVTSLSIGFQPSFLDIIVITPVILMLTMIPVSPNNIGWWEWCFSILLADAGATAAEGLAVALTLRAFTLAVSLIGGVLLLYKRQTQTSS